MDPIGATEDLGILMDAILMTPMITRTTQSGMNPQIVGELGAAQIMMISIKLGTQGGNHDDQP